MTNTNNPKSKQQDIVVQELNGEILIYDLSTHKAFCLNETSALVWQLCDGNNSVSQISQIISKKLNSTANEDLVWLALDQLRDGNLIENNGEMGSVFKGISRREAIRKVGIGCMVALPLISSLVAPMAADAQSLAGPTTCSGSCTCTTGSSGTLNNTACSPAFGFDCNAGCRCVRQTGSPTDFSGVCTT